MAEKSSQEKRRYPRIELPTGIWVAWQGGGKQLVTSVRNVSLGGMFICVPEPPPVGTIIRLLVDVPNGELRGRAVVRRVEPQEGMGVEFISLSQKDRALLVLLVKQPKVAAQAGAGQPASAWPTRWFMPDSQNLYSGEIRGRHALLTLLNRIYSSRLTGMLQLLLGRVEKQLYFNAGQLIFARSNVPEHGLGEMMIRAGAITQSQFDEAFSRVQAGQRLGAALVEMGICDTAELAEWVRRQVTQIASSIFDNPAGRYYFFTSFDEHVFPEVGIALPLGTLMLKAVRNADDLPLDRLAQDGGVYVDLSPDPVPRFQAVELNEIEQRVLNAIFRPTRAAEVIQTIGPGKSEAARALYALLALGILVVVSGDAQPRPKAASPVSPPEAVAQPAAPSADKAEELLQFEQEMKRLLELAEIGTYYQLLGVEPSSAAVQIKANFYRQARKFHPDRHMGRSEWIGSLQKLMSALTEAYRTLTDEQARSSYDKRLAESGAYTLGRGKTEVQESAEECLNRAMELLQAENFPGSVLWLRKCVELAPDVAKYHAMLARSLAAVPQYRQESVQHFQKAIELDPWNVSAYFQFAELYEEMELPWRARPLYEKILEIDPGHSKARERLRQLDAQAR